AAALVGLLQGGVVLAVAPLLVEVTGPGMVAALGALALGALSSATLGSLVAARLRSVENFAGVINLVLFPLLFLSGALYPTSTLPAPLAVAARLNPVTYQVDLLRHALGQPTELGAASDAAALVLTTLVAFVLATALFDPERRLAGARSRGADGASGSAAGPR
ncbi:MAG TPA: ABC transporter permease, partial [Gemmatimonadales bacterium]|nr:ABC transporter permease [Gemmatimonadales bacterium]